MVSDAPATRSPALGGFDPVAYFTQSRSVRGSERYTLEHDGRTWLFADDANRKAFEEAPERYLPAYGGHCAFAASLGKTERGDPTRWTVRDGRLFLNSNPVANALWKLFKGRAKAADRNWSAGKIG